ncbi:MAG: flagellar hook-associated protein FlgK [Phycisphaerales bacterium JB039]
MGLTSALQIGHSALTASQIGIQLTGQNMANAATPGYSRQLIGLAPARGDQSILGLSIGSGVQIRGIQRAVDAALVDRLRAGVSSEHAAGRRLDLLSQVESTLNELTGEDISSELSAFFNSWSERASLTDSSATVVQQGKKLADFLGRTRSELERQRSQIDRELTAVVNQADLLLGEVGRINEAIAEAEVGGAQANALRDQRDQLVTELSALIDVSVVEQPSGQLDVLSGSIPLVLGGASRGIELRRQSAGGAIEVSIHVRGDGSRLQVDSGAVGALLEGREGSVNRMIDELDTITGQLIFQVNKLHATGVADGGYRSLTGTTRVAPSDISRSLNSPLNASLTDLPFAPQNGSLLVHVRDAATGQLRTTQVEVDLDGIASDGSDSSADDMSLADFVAALDAVDGVSARLEPDGRVAIEADPGAEFSFAEDSSGVLAALGINSYFTGTDASNIAVREDLLASPGQLAVGAIDGAGQLVDNGAALAIAGLQDVALDALGGQTIRGAWTTSVQRIGVETDAALTQAEATRAVREGLEAQRAAVSGVSLDEEAINLITYQQAFQGAARFVSVVNDLQQLLMNII